MLIYNVYSSELWCEFDAITVSNLFEPGWHFACLVLSHVDVNDGHRKEWRECYQNHIQAEIGAWNIKHTDRRLVSK